MNVIEPDKEYFQMQMERNPRHFLNPHETARYGEIASAIWNFSFAAWKWVNMDGNWRNFDGNISSYV